MTILRSPWSPYVLSVYGSRIRQNSGNLCTAHRSVRSLGDFGYMRCVRFVALAR